MNKNHPVVNLGGHHLRRLLLSVVFITSLALIAPPAFSYPDGHYTPTLKQEANGSELGAKILHGIRTRLHMPNRVWAHYNPDGPAGGKEIIVVEDMAADGKRVAAQWQVLTAGTQGVITKGICVNARGYGVEQSFLFYCELPYKGEKSTIRIRVGYCDGSTSACNSYGDWTWTTGDQYSNGIHYVKAGWIDYTDDADTVIDGDCNEADRERDC